MGLHLATAVHVVVLVGIVFVVAFTAIELVPFPDVKDAVKEIVAVPAVDDVLASDSPQPLVVARAPVDHVIASLAGKFVPARLAVQDVFAPVGGGFELHDAASAIQRVAARPP